MPPGRGVSAIDTLGIRPEHVALVEKGQGIPARIDFVEHLGDHQVVYAELLHKTQRIIAKVPMTHRFDCEDGEIGIDLPAAWCHLFDRDGRVSRAAA